MEALQPVLKALDTLTRASARRAGGRGAGGEGEGEGGAPGAAAEGGAAGHADPTATPAGNPEAGPQALAAAGHVLGAFRGGSHGAVIVCAGLGLGLRSAVSGVSARGLAGGPCVRQGACAGLSPALQARCASGMGMAV